jgi:hypothetical protein
MQCEDSGWFVKLLTDLGSNESEYTVFKRIDDRQK